MIFLVLALSLEDVTRRVVKITNIVAEKLLYIYSVLVISSLFGKKTFMFLTCTSKYVYKKNHQNWCGAQFPNKLASLKYFVDANSHNRRVIQNSKKNLSVSIFEA